MRGATGGGSGGTLFLLWLWNTAMAPYFLNLPDMPVDVAMVAATGIGAMIGRLFNSKSKRKRK